MYLKILKRIQKYIVEHYFLFLILVLSVSYFCFGTYRNWPYKIESDGKYYYQFLVSGILDGDFNFTNNYNAEKYEWMLLEIDHYRLREKVNPITGKPINFFSIGPALLWLPFFIIAAFLGNMLNMLNFSIDLNPYGKYFQYATMYAGVVYSYGGLFLLYKLLTLYFSRSISRIAIWLILVMSPLYYYTIFEPSMSHVYDFFTFILLLCLFVQYCKKPTFCNIILLGMAGVLNVLMRTQNIATIVIISIVILLQYLRSPDCSFFVFLGKMGSFAMILILGLSPILLTNNYLFGHPLAIPQGAGFLDWTNPQILSLLFSPRNGLFSHHPILFLGLVGYLFFLVKENNEKYLCSFLIALFVIVAVQVYINSTTLDWWSGHSFGQRRLLFSLPLFALGLGYFFEKIKLYNISNYKRFIVPATLIGTVGGVYLTFIHVFLWDYDQPHNIFKWMIYYAPLKLLFSSPF